MMFIICDSDGFFYYFCEFYYNIVFVEIIGEEKYIVCLYLYIFYIGIVKMKLFEIENRKLFLEIYNLLRYMKVFFNS